MTVPGTGMFCRVRSLSDSLSLTHETRVLMTHPATINEILLILYGLSKLT